MGDSMNQVLKDTVYGKGTQKQVDMLAQLGGMNDEETRMLNLFHRGYTETAIKIEMGLSSNNSFARIESAVRAKLTIAIFTCINAMEDRLEN